jgi:hypothetical protein
MIAPWPRSGMFASISPNPWRSGARSGPSSPRRIFQLIVRIRKLVKNGAMTRKRMRFL